MGLQASSHLEIHCHGGSYAAAAVMKRLTQNGATIVPWQQVASLMESDGIAAEARVALSNARTERTARILLEQYYGALRKCLDLTIANLESFPAEFDTASKRLGRLLDLAPLGKHLTIPWRVFIAGEPNVGKSSLMNALVGYQRSIVFDQPGTTRDLLTASTALEGWPVEFVDSAGLRDSEDVLESAGVARATAGLAVADLVLWVEDARAPLAASRMARPCDDVLTLNVKNKADLLTADEVPQNAGTIAVSALTGQGLHALCRQIVQRLLPVSPTPGEAVLFSSRHEVVVREAAAALSAGNSALAVGLLRSL